jgi:hypothetical protein
LGKKRLLEIAIYIRRINMIRTVRIEAGQTSFSVSLDENLLWDNTWKRIGSNPTVCPASGIWKFGQNANKHYLYLIDNGGNTILYFCDLGKTVGDRGLAQFLANGFGIARDVILGWEIQKVEAEWGD